MENHVKVVSPPEFPTVDTTVFRSLATSTHVPGKARQKNIRVPAGKGADFSAGDVIEGILYIESPNTVTFSGHAEMNGIIVFENKNGPGENKLDFRGNVSPASIPPSKEFDDVRAVAPGIAILAPRAAVTMSGSVDATLTGSLIAHQVTLGGSADVAFKNGSLISLGPQPVVVGGKVLSFTGTGMVLPPKAGISYSGYLKLSPWTYREVY
jgi:hypothetical protein